MEPEVKEFLRRVITTLSIGLLWMVINSTAGIMYGYAFFEHGIKLGNILFYIWFLASLTMLIWYMYKLWTKPMGESDGE